MHRTQTRNHIWYVTIDPEDNCRPDHNRHRRNLTRLQAIAERVGIRVDPIWMPHLQAEMLEAENLLALFGSGSFSEWLEYTQNPGWAAELDRYCELLRTTHVPMLAVCGTHQLVVRAFDGWDAVGHMVPKGQVSRSIGDEIRQQRSLIPQPRLGEVGDFPLRVCAEHRDDPLFAGLPDVVWFVESHCDQALAGRIPSFVSLMENAQECEPLFFRPDEAASDGKFGHLNPHHPEERCEVQALRLNSSERILYSLGFHPELPAWVDPTIDWQSERLLCNFFEIATEYWG